MDQHKFEPPRSDPARGLIVRCVHCRRMLDDSYPGTWDEEGSPVCLDQDRCKRRGTQHVASVGVAPERPEGLNARQGLGVLPQWGVSDSLPVTWFVLLVRTTVPDPRGHPYPNTDGVIRVPICPGCAHTDPINQQDPDQWEYKEGVLHHKHCGPSQLNDLRRFRNDYAPKEGDVKKLTGERVN